MRLALLTAHTSEGDIQHRYMAGESPKHFRTRSRALCSRQASGELSSRRPIGGAPATQRVKSLHGSSPARLTASWTKIRSGRLR
jgi:hypothetical protein